MEQQPEVLKPKHDGLFLGNAGAAFFKEWHHYLVPGVTLLVSHLLFQLPGFFPGLISGGLSIFALEYYRRNHK